MIAFAQKWHLFTAVSTASCTVRAACSGPTAPTNSNGLSRRASVAKKLLRLVRHGSVGGASLAMTMLSSKDWPFSMNLWGRHPVCRFGRHLAARNTRQGCPVNRQAGKPAPQDSGSWPRFASHLWRLSLSMNLPFLQRKRCVPEESVAAARVEGTQPSGCSAGSWSQCVSKLKWGLPMNRAIVA